MKQYPISVEAQIAAFEKQAKKPADDLTKTFLSMLTELENMAYEQGKADALNGKPDDITRFPAPLNCIKRVILSDGTIYDNVVYETETPILTGDEMSAATGFDLEKWRADYAARLDAQKEKEE